ncbi:MAG: sodium:calcium antiporter [Chloroflexota bacterium]|nr:MAG: sodium:calcium antiporter [Chloroflexota bacterium]
MRNWLWIAVAMLVAVPWLVLRFAGLHEPPYLVAALAGLAILGAALLLSWASEVAQLDISQALAVVILSLIAVLPEYSVDIYFAWRAGQDPSYGAFALANMTGANRMLIGIGWVAVVVVFWWRTRRPKVELAEHESLEISVLSIATLYVFLIPLKGTLSIWDSVVLFALFGVYAYASSRQAPEEPDLVGPAAAVGSLSTGLRRLVTLGLFLFAAAAILISAEPFAEGLVSTGRLLYIDEFVLVQWLAPFASEAPEFIVAVLFALRGHPHLGLRTMVSSKVNQWTLLVGALPLAYALSAGQLLPLELDERQMHEVFLTAAQSAFAVVLLAGTGLTLRGAATLGVLFFVQLVFPETRLVMSIIYLVLTVAILVFDRKRLVRLIRAPRKILSSAP